MESPNTQDWAALYYRVERDSTGLSASRRKLRKITEQAVRHGDPIPEESRDVVRIIDRDGRIVMERDWGRNRQAAADEEARIVDDLLKLNVVQFRVRYGIVLEPEILDEGREEPPPGASGGSPSGPQADAGADGKPEGASG